jgi:hypothetical protein
LGFVSPPNRRHLPHCIAKTHAETNKTVVMLIPSLIYPAGGTTM